MQCIEKETQALSVKSMQSIFDGVNAGGNKAVDCAVVPQAGFYRGIAGKDARGLPGNPGDMWQGKQLMNCVDANCTGRELVNYMQSHIQGRWTSAYKGAWSTTTSWSDGKAAALISYPEEMPDARDELRPWCVCNVKTFLGLLFFGTEPTKDPWLSFVLVPPDAKDGDCPASSAADQAFMCSAA